MNDRDRQIAETLAAKQKADVLDAVKEAIGEILAGRSKRLIGDDDRLYWLHIETVDFSDLVACVGRSLDMEGLEHDYRFDFSRVKTVADMRDALCAAMFAEKATAP